MEDTRLKIESVIQKIEDDLNIALQEVSEGDTIYVNLHTSAGWETLPEQEGKKLIYTIDGAVEDLAISSNKLDDSIGTLALNLTLACPLEQVKTTDTEKIQDYDGRNYPFFISIYNKIQEYFSKPIIYNNLENTDGGKTMRFSFESSAGMGDVTQQWGKIVISISGTYSGAEHIFSNEIKIFLDGIFLPQTSLTPYRSHSMETEVGEDRVLRSFNTMSSVGFNITIPASVGEKAKPIMQTLLRGNLAQYQNKPHFLEITGSTFGETYSTSFLMLVKDPQMNMAGTEVSSLSCDLVECSVISALLNLDDFQVVKKTYETSKQRTLSIETSEDTYISVVGETTHLQKGQRLTVDVKDTDYELSHDLMYYVTIIASNKKATLTIQEE